MRNTRKNYKGGGMFDAFKKQITAFNPFGGESKTFSSNCKEVKQTLTNVKTSLQSELKKIEDAIRTISDMELKTKSVPPQQDVKAPVAPPQPPNFPQEGGGRRRNKRRKKTRRKRKRRRRKTHRRR